MRSERRCCKQDLGVAVDELFAQFTRGGEGGKRYDDGAYSRRSQHPDDEGNAVGVEQSDMSALAGAKSDESATQQRRKPLGVRVADAFGVADQQRMIAPTDGL